MDGHVLLLFLSATFLGGFVSGFSGFAMGIVVSGIWLHLITPIQTAALIASYGLLTQGYCITKLRHELDWRDIWPLTLGTAIGIPAGVMLLTYINPVYLHFGIGVLLVLYATYSLMRPPLGPFEIGKTAGVADHHSRSAHYAGGLSLEKIEEQHHEGRQLQRRPGYDIDVEKVLRACARHGVAVEINAHPWRLDLDWRWHQTALDFGCMMSINPDAHSNRVLNAMPLAKLFGIFNADDKQHAVRPSVPAKRASSDEHSAGLLLYRQVDGNIQVLLGHHGGPF